MNLGVEVVKTSYIDVYRVRMGTRNIERSHSTVPTKKMLRRVRPERIAREVILAIKQKKGRLGDDQVEVAFLSANGAVAFENRCKRSCEFKANPPTVTAALPPGGLTPTRLWPGALR